MENNYCVIMSGGIGSRFWPASRSTYPKQFLDFFGTGQSLLQQTYSRFSKIIPTENIFIVSNQLYGKLIQEQLPGIDPKQILLEPQRRNTAPCIAFASHHIRAVNPKANIVVAPSDHVILKEDDFLEHISEGLKFVKENEVLLTIGIKPNRPETGYGYIQKGHQTIASFTKAKAFTEKPNLELAQVFVESGEFLWNSGIFLWNVQSILKAFEEFLPDIHSTFSSGKHLFNTPKEADFIEKIFSSCPNISIDYSIMEKAPNVYVQEGNFGWSDLGTWGSLHELSPKDKNNNVILKCKALCYESSNNIITLPEGKLAVVQKIDGYIVAESDNVLMICKKEDEQEIRQYVIDAQLKFGDSFV
ncbi:MAG: mannose-1-phosphate guanylyltransferase [Bacteroidales bacterium]|nr:mannose-1-phosphate guanylyltransferase [Bacteroidales bacterium]MDD4362407.1 mannose-1-phosphate guanylyltransferase [Bacteroidales bacterium]MDD4430443.1 mannose-1-phosphate guanylyltransferase [Bacteroidales bacterium]